MKIVRITVAEDQTGVPHVDFFFDDGLEEPWAVDEFVPGTRTHEWLAKIEAAIIDFNNDVGVPNPGKTPPAIVKRLQELRANIDDFLQGES